jgi:hypothetical protein
VGVAVFGSLVSSRLAELLGSSKALGITPSELHELPAAERAQTAAAFADAIGGVFLLAVPVLVTGFALTWLLREKVLRTSSGMDRRGTLEH